MPTLPIFMQVYQILITMSETINLIHLYGSHVYTGVRFIFLTDGETF